MKQISRLAPVVAFAALLCRAATGPAAAVENVEASGSLSSAAWLSGVPSCGMALAQEGDVLYYGGGSELVTLDVACPATPQIVGRVGGLGNVRQICVQDGWAYVATRETGLWIVDARRPDGPRVASHFDCLELATGVDVAGDVLFLGQRSYGVEFVDVSDKTSPRHITYVKTPESQSVKYVDGILYSGDWYVGNVTVIEAGNPSSARIVSTAKLSGYGDGLDVRGEYLYASTGHNRKPTGRNLKQSKPDGAASSGSNNGEGHGLEIWRRKDGGRSLGFVSRVEFPVFYNIGYDMWTVRSDNVTAFCADTFNGLFAVDVSSKASPKIVGRLRTGSPVTSIAIGDGVVYVSDARRGLGVVRCPLARRMAHNGRAIKPTGASWRRPYPTSPESHFTAWLPQDVGQVRSVSVSSGVLYVACGEAGLYALDAATQRVLDFRAGFCGDVRVEGNRLYAAQGADGLGVYDIQCKSAGLAKREIARTRAFGDGITLALWCWVPSGDKIVVSDRAKGLVFLDKATLARINRIQGGPGWNRYVAADVGHDGLLAWFQANTGVAWYDLRKSPVSLAAKSQTLRPGSTSGVCKWRDNKLLMTHQGLFKVFPYGSVVPESEFPIPGGHNGEPAWDGEHTVALAERYDRRVSLYRLSDGRAERLWEENLSGSPECPVFAEGRLYLPCGYQGLLVQKPGARSTQTARRGDGE